MILSSFIRNFLKSLSIFICLTSCLSNGIVIRKRIPYRTYKNTAKGPVRRITPARRMSPRPAPKKKPVATKPKTKTPLKRRDKRNFATYSHETLGYIRNSPNKLIKTGPKGQQAYWTNNLGQRLPVVVTTKRPTGKSSSNQFYLGGFFNPETRRVEYAYLDINLGKSSARK